ncbi:flagellar protein FlaG [Aquitalea sp. S1-19]|uniref:Flagellin n=1 Tax=Craterilacuibacter sinensis TaxID=2686017 RepID=A0A845BJI0_9NEIS|nr:flagellar protein FlaG [Craterilacuibacter sinensis]MCP9760009.1 flagellar protein FlaG [Aquitalea sp. S1-19]MXR35424.1 flagellin [Craterilacuibacter sinensis]
MTSLGPMTPVGGGYAAPIQNEPGSRSQPLSSQQSSAPTVAVASTAVQALGSSEAGRQMKGGADEQALKGALEKVNKLVSAYSSELKFSVDEDTGIDVVKVIDKETDQVIRQMPSEEMLKIAQSLDKIVGVLFKDKA